MKFPFISSENPLILASASPRREELLRQTGIPFQIQASNIIEHKTGFIPEELCCHLAQKKAVSVRAVIGNYWVLGADTLVLLGNQLLGKPKDTQEARQMLLLLNGREHAVITGICILDPSGQTACLEAISTNVYFKKLTEQEIDGYINTEEPYGKAGSYAIQGIGAFMVESLSGSYSNVVGLPLCALIKALVKIRALNKFPLS